MTHTDHAPTIAVMEPEDAPYDTTDVAARPAAAAAPDPALLDNVARHLRLHPQAQVHDDRGRLRNLTRHEAEQIAHVALRAARAWLKAADGAGDAR